MDEAGYSPLALVASYPNVAYYGATIVDLMDKISGKEDSPLEVDRENETIRLKEGWEKVCCKHTVIEKVCILYPLFFVYHSSFHISLFIGVFLSPVVDAEQLWRHGSTAVSASSIRTDE